MAFKTCIDANLTDLAQARIDDNPPSTGDANKGIAILILVTGLPIHIFFFVWYVKRAKESFFLGRRNQPMMILFFVGQMFQYSWAIREIVGRDSFPCVWQLSLWIWLLGFQAAPLAIRSILFYNRLKFNKLVASHKFDLATTSGGVYAENGGKKPSLVSSVSASSSKISAKKLHRYKFFASRRFGLYLWILWISILLVDTFAARMKDLYQCTGCKLTDTDLAFVGAVLVFVGMINGFTAWKLRREPDVLKIKSELGVNMILPAILYALWFLLFLMDINQVHERGRFCWHYFLILANMVQFVILIPLQLRYSYQPENLNSGADEGVSYLQLLDSEIGRQLFKAHLCNELTIENYLFYSAAIQWKGLQESDRVEKFESIYNDFIATGSPFEINVSSNQKDDVFEALTVAQKDGYAPEDALDSCLGDIMEFLRGSSYRFFRSDLYKDNYKQTLSIVDGNEERL